MSGGQSNLRSGDVGLRCDFACRSQPAVSRVAPDPRHNWTANPPGSNAAARMRPANQDLSESMQPMLHQVWHVDSGVLLTAQFAAEVSRTSLSGVIVQLLLWSTHCFARSKRFSNTDNDARSHAHHQTHRELGREDISNLLEIFGPLSRRHFRCAGLASRDSMLGLPPLLNFGWETLPNKPS